MKMHQKVWLVVGRDGGFGRAMSRYLQNRNQVVIHILSFQNLLGDLKAIVSRYDAVDMLIVQDIESDSRFDILLEDVYKIASLMRRDGTSQIIFFSSHVPCFEKPSEEVAYQVLKSDMQNLAIEVKCFAPGY